MHYLNIFSRTHEDQKMVPPPPPPSVTSPSGPVIEFPFNFLHAEVVKYYQHRYEEHKEKQNKFFTSKAVGDGTFVDDTSKTFLQLAAKNNPETRLEAIGYRIGYSLVEKVAQEQPRITSELDMMKFICKEFWVAVFGKQVDNLRTNHQNIYVVQDNKFVTLTSFAEGTQYIKEASLYLALPTGVIRGALANLGIKSVVHAAVDVLPVVKFNITLQKTAS